MICCSLVLYLGSLFVHPLHVSMTSIDVNSATNEISISHRFFTDDFSLLFFHLYEKQITPLEYTEFTEGELEIITTYLTAAFQVKTSQGEQITLQYNGKKQNEEAIWLYFTGSISEDPVSSNLTIGNRIMLDLYGDQTNLVIVAVDGKEKGLRFDMKTREARVGL